MHGPDGTDYVNKNRFTEVVKNQRIVFEHVSYPHHLTTLTFAAEGNKTQLKWQMIFESAEELKQVVKTFKADDGLAQNLHKLEAHLHDMKSAETKELTLTRTFNAPRELVFKAWSTPQHMAHWWGPKGFTMENMSLDFRPGGVFHYCMKAPNGHEMWGRFVYQEINAPESIVFVNSFSDTDGNITRSPFSATWPLEILNKLTLTEDEGKTTLTLKGRPVNANEEELNTFAAMTSGMEQGFKGTFDQLDEYLAGLNTKATH
jgi:uncharacterized protein YndB with AHSA1/START domain